ncbi:MAG: HEPN domain-containing protein [Opitutaceae bacterium]|nr:HEPN domain-containing protein [Opitutaceae bacterium]
METDGEALRWLDFAREDLAYGGFGLERFPRAAAWSFQQAGEKALKAGLVAKSIVPPRTHDLVLLLNLLDPNGSEELRTAVLQLAEISAAARYPDDDAEPVDVTLARSYEAAAKTVVLHAAQQLAQK